MVTVLATIAMLMVAQGVFAAGEIVEIKPLDASKLNEMSSTAYWIISGVGATIIMAAGLVHSMLLSTAARNGNKKAVQFEAIGVVFISLFLFFAFPLLAGVLRGFAESGM